MTERTSEGLDPRRRRLLYRAWHCGVREMDLIVGRFADACIEQFDDAQLGDFERLLDVPGHELYAWVTGAAEIPAGDDSAVLQWLKDFHARPGAQP